MSDFSRRAWLFCSILVAVSAQTHVCEAADKSAAILQVKDALTVPGQPATVEAKLEAKGVLADVALGGEPLELIVDGKAVATAMTGGDGRAFLTYTTKTQGVIPIQVRVGGSARVLPAGGQANLLVWERRSPILAIDMASLMDEPRAPSPLPAIGLRSEPERKPMPDAAEEIWKLTQFYYKVIYVIPSLGSDGFLASTQARAWLMAHRFPPGYVMASPSGKDALGGKIDDLRASGWKTIKGGIGRTNAFADVFLQRRLEAVIVPEPNRGEASRKAKVAKDWKEVRKKL